MRKSMAINILFLFSLTFCIYNSEGEGPKFRCNFDAHKITPKPSKLVLPIQKRSNIKSFAASSNEQYKDFNIFLDFEQLNYQISEYSLNRYKDFFVNGVRRAITTLQALLKVKPATKNYQYTDDEILDIGIEKWDKTKIGDQAKNKNIGLLTLGIDLYIFVNFNDDLSDNAVAGAAPMYYDDENKRPIIGLISLNRNIDYSIVNSRHFFESTVIHEVTHVLGFNIIYFKDFHMTYTSKDRYGIERIYLKSQKVLNVARKYFNCNSITGVPLEDYGGVGTVGSHWEERYLLGDYMIGYVYKEEQVISEFTLAALEDLGYYKANYYTGGLMKFGKNKGCEFINSQCVVNKRVNPKFKNEFFDNYINDNEIDPGCTSGRLSRVYHSLKKHDNEIPRQFDYFGQKYYNGRKGGEYCPTFTENMEEDGNIYYVGHCSIGTGDYGSFSSSMSSDLQSYTKEKYSKNAFCALSSLIPSRIENSEYYSEQVRAVCYEMSCSDKSLSIIINFEYIVCPRAGGKIKPLNFNGYLLCPDYYLICSGTVLCNDLFDCVEKKSLLKDDITYDYEIKTTQDLKQSEKDEFSEDNYELSTNGKCPKYCKQCNILGQCTSCRNHFAIAEIKINNKINKICVHENKLNKGYYIDEKNSIYYKCLDNCAKCNNKEKCISCNEGYKLSDNGDSCLKQINILFIIIPSIVIALIIMIIIIVFFAKFLSKGKDLGDDVNKISFKKNIDDPEEDLIE